MIKCLIIIQIELELEMLVFEVITNLNCSIVLFNATGI